MRPERGAAVKVLVADDNPDAAQMLGMLLESAGYQVQLCYGGAQAIDAIARWQPAVALIDLGMPGIDGLEVARRTRAESWGLRVRMIALTGWGRVEDQLAAESAGFDRHLVKPVELNDIEREIISFDLAAPSD